MKAKFIYEAQHFERGGEPLDTLDIGLVQERKLNKIFRKMQGIAMEYDVDINQVKLDKENLYASVEISGREYVIGLSIPYIQGEEEREEYTVAYIDVKTSDVSNDTFDSEYSTLEEAAAWVREEIDLYANNYMNEAQDFTRGEEAYDSLAIGRMEERKIQKIREATAKKMQEIMVELDLDPNKLEDSSIEGSKIIAFSFEFRELKELPYFNLEVAYRISYSHKYERFKVKFYIMNQSIHHESDGDETYYDMYDGENLDEVLELCKQKLLYYYQINQ